MWMKTCHLVGIRNLSDSPPELHTSCQAACSRPSALQWEKAQSHQPHSSHGRGTETAITGVLLRKLISLWAQHLLRDLWQMSGLVA